MTAEMAGKAAAEGVWATLRRIREQWMLVAFVAGAVFWARDAYQEIAALPALVRQQGQGLGELEAAVVRLELEVGRRAHPDRSPALGFPGNRHTVEDGTPGAWTVLTWRPVRRLRQDCAPGAVDAWMVDAAGAWFAVESALAPMPAIEGEHELPPPGRR